MFILFLKVPAVEDLERFGPLQAGGFVSPAATARSSSGLIPKYVYRPERDDPER
jgi:hypothetical protein